MTKLESMPSKDAETFGGLLRQARHDAGFTQSQLVRVSGIPKPTLSRYENGHVMPSLGTLARLADALNVPEGALLPGRSCPEEDFFDALHELGVEIATREDAYRIAAVVAEAVRNADQKLA